MPEPRDPQLQEAIPENLSKQERFQKLGLLFLEAEHMFAIEGREAAKPLLNRIYDDLIVLNKRSKEEWKTIWIWNPEGDLTEQEFDEMNLRRKLLSNAIGIKTASGAIRHDLNTI